MSVLQSLFESHARNVAKVNKWYSKGDALPTLKAWIRAEQLVRLDVLLMKHRKEYATDWEPLLGANAVTHLMFLRTGWTPELISHLSFDDILLVLQQDLAGVKIPEGEIQVPQYVAAELQQLKLLPYQIEWPPHSKGEWDPSLCETALGLRRSA
ncbi:ECs1072 family phage-associated protein [Klebsiella variicola]|uniref:ECs1072 family phage-associated protein n=1 Tax=Klebsiella variicola TaxID=244366 RepID=UPI0034D1596B